MATPAICREVGQTWSFRGTKSRNKVTVGEPAVGSLLMILSAVEVQTSCLTNTLCTVMYFGSLARH